MKKLMYLAITFFTFIFSFIAPLKNNFNININNNKIVEKLEPKKAFENAPKKTNDLPSFNKDFKIFLNFSNIYDLINFAEPFLNDSNIPNYDTEIPYIVFYGDTEIEIDNEIQSFQLLMTFNKVQSFEESLEFKIVLIMEDNFSGLHIKVVKIGDGYIVNINDNEVRPEEDQTSEEISFFNEVFSSVYFNSYDKYMDFNVNIVNFNNYIYGYDLVSSSAVPGLIGVISSIATGLLSLLISLFSSVVVIFWNVSNNTPTFLGVIILFVVAVPITYWVINFVIGLIRKIRLTRGK